MTRPMESNQESMKENNEEFEAVTIALKKKDIILEQKF
jgi:hypothetical protein